MTDRFTGSRDFAANFNAVRQLISHDHAICYSILTIAFATICWGFFFWHGYFRYDDFEVMSLNPLIPLSKQIFTIHGDHTIPLFRLQMWLLGQISTSNPFIYNTFHFIIFITIPIVTFFLLREFHVSVEASYIFLILYYTWIGWSDIVSGYYILSVYTQVSLFGCASILFLQKYINTHKPRFATLSLFFVVLTLTVDLAGVVIAPVLSIFLMKNALDYGSVRSFVRKHSLVLQSFAGVLLAFAVYLGFVFQVVHPGLFLNMAEPANQSTGQLGVAGRACSILSNEIVGTLPGLNWQPPTLSSRYNNIATMLFGVLCARVVVILVKAKCFADFTFVCAIGFSLFICILMVAVGRPQGWASKHFVISYFWFALLAAVVLSNVKRDLSPLLAGPRLFVCVSCICMTTPLLIYGKANLSRFSTARWQVNSSRLRQHQVNELLMKVANPLKQLSGVQTVPTLDGNYIFSKFEELYKYDLSHYLQQLGLHQDHVQLVRNPAMSTWRNSSVNTVTNMRPAVSPKFKSALLTNENLRQFYFHPIVLNDVRSGYANLNVVTDVKMPVVCEEVPRVLKDEAESLLLFAGPMNVQYGMVIAIGLSAIADAPFEIELYFKNDFAANGPLGRVKIGTDRDEGIQFLSPNNQLMLRIALDQLYAFALSDSVSDIRIKLKGEATVQIESVESFLTTVGRTSEIDLGGTSAMHAKSK